jgi:hypothetical protein
MTLITKRPVLFATVVAVVTVIATAFIIVLHFGGPPLEPSTATSMKSLSSNGYRSTSCLQEVPDHATIEMVQNSTFVGYSVTFPNASAVTFPLDSCPVPVHTDGFNIAAAIQANPKFIVAENGSLYKASPFTRLNESAYVNSTAYAVVGFNLYSDHRLYPCGDT